MDNNITLKKITKHIKLINKHKWVVFKLACRAGIPYRGFLHDFSKFSPTEFVESVKYYVGDHSPIIEAKKDKGYSEAWLHHKGRNKHHTEYWIDETAPTPTPMPPYKYVVEMLCDKTAAGLAYKGKTWTQDYQLSYYMKEREKIKINSDLDKLFIEFFTKLSNDGIKMTFNKQYIRDLYNKYSNLVER